MGSGVEPLLEDKDEEQLMTRRLLKFCSEKKLRWRGVRETKEVGEVEIGE